MLITVTHCAEAKTMSGCGVQLMCRNISICSFLATGDSYTGLSAHFRLGKKTVYEIMTPAKQYGLFYNLKSWPSLQEMIGLKLKKVLD